MANPISKIKQYYGETLLEIKRCTWPSRDELLANTGLVIGVMLVLTIYVFVVDQVCRLGLEGLISLITKSGN